MLLNAGSLWNVIPMQVSEDWQTVLMYYVGRPSKKFATILETCDFWFRTINSLETVPNVQRPT